MTIVGFSFDKIVVEKFDFVQGKINISNNVSMQSVEPAELGLGKAKQKGLKFTYEFTSKYEPKAGNILINGHVLFMTDEKKSREVLDSWKKSKKIPKDVMSDVLNTVLAKCNIEALILSKEVNLPPPMPLPRVNVESKA